VQSVIFGALWSAMAAGEIRIGADDFFGMLVDGTYRPDAVRHAVRGDVVGEVSGPGYAAGGLPIVVAALREGAGLRITFGLQVWRAASITARGQVVYRRGAAGHADVLLMAQDFGEDITSTADDFRVAGSSITIGG
jgi:hypothetical protein